MRISLLNVIPSEINTFGLLFFSCLVKQTKNMLDEGPAGLD